MKKWLQYIAILTLSAFIFSCREAYTPPQIKINVSYLVVDGQIINNDTTVIKLARTINLANSATTQVETGAKINVESDANVTYVLKETATNGTYASSAPLILSPNAKYRLRIVTSGNKTYLSDFVQVKDAPPIDSVNYVLQPNGAQIYVSSHDPANNTHYYRYEYVETWIFYSAFSSEYIYINSQVVPRDIVNDNINTCWANAYSTDITLASSAKLTTDIVPQTPVAFVPASSVKLRIRYTINVKQYALTEDAFNFWQVIKTNTQQLGSIFDAQPSQIQGNVHNINDNTEPVFGYVSAGAVQQKRIFIDRMALPYTYQPVDPYAACYALNSAVEVPLANLNQFSGLSLIPISQYSDEITGQLAGYVGATRECTDCTLRGYNHKPSFWY